MQAITFGKASFLITDPDLGVRLEASSQFPNYGRSVTTRGNTMHINTFQHVSGDLLAASVKALVDADVDSFTLTYKKGS